MTELQSGASGCLKAMATASHNVSHSMSHSMSHSQQLPAAAWTNEEMTSPEGVNDL